MAKGKTSIGFNYNVDNKRISSWEVTRGLARLAKIDDEDEDSLLELINTMADIEECIFEDKGKAFEKFIKSKSENGLLDTELVLSQLMEIISNSESKNS